ncbi:hypothetical protein [Gordonia sp. ABSL49_1]|uniref:hypothetical protein n=1 Tax=Gordonia sp. ABSL49_1 TaxID=2920941 RepID=UPI001F0D3318|nr:hypothetical protein [Gordonia sp. ABSL49_1]MCH5643408.1 hypothetical protein [Gordonia sp. ABSL49_1]
MTGLFVRRILLGAAAVSTVVTAAVYAAPADAAVVSGPRIVNPSGFGSVGTGYGAGCTYVIEARITPKSGKTVVLAGRVGTRAATLYNQVPPPEATKVTVWWTPPSPGRYRISAGQSSSPDGRRITARSMIVDVRLGVNTGSSCIAV